MCYLFSLYSLSLLPFVVRFTHSVAEYRVFFIFQITIFFLRENAKDFALHFIEKVEDIEGTTSRRRDTHTLTTVLTKRLQLGKEVPSTTNRNNIRPSPSLASSQEWRGIEARSNEAASLPLPGVSRDDYRSRTADANTPDPCA